MSTKGSRLARWHVPSDPTPLFRKPQRQLERLYERVKDDPPTKTQKTLWLEQLRGSGNHPIPSHEDALFVTHTLLTLVSRMISGKKVPKRVDHTGYGLLAGYVSWTARDIKILQSMQDLIEMYDWSSNQRDLLRSIYRNLVDKTHRRIYGEYYTPDWLAEKICLDVIDDAYIKKQLDNFTNGDPLNGIMDPACGSGAFLYHAGKRLKESKPVTEAMEKGMLKEHELTEFVLRMVCGIDIHPVAVEMAIANMHRLLERVDPDRIRVYQGDSLLVEHEKSASTMDAHFETIDTKEYLILQSPCKKTLRLPLNFVKNQNNTAKLVNATVNKEKLPQSTLASLSEDEKKHVQMSFETLKEIIKEEGNGVWAWYIKNQSAPLIISRDEKAGRIVANPPWVRMNKIKDSTRSRQMSELGKVYDVYVGGKNATSFDIASAFVLRTRDLYLADGGKEGWVLPRAAIMIEGQWKKMRDSIGAHLQVDLGSLAFPEHATSCYIRTNTKPARQIFQRRNVKLNPEDSWAAASKSIAQRKVRLKGFQSMPSKFAEKGKIFARNGATIFPSNLVIVDRMAENGSSVSFETTKSRHGIWKKIGPQRGTVPRDWIKPCVFASNLSAFCCTSMKKIILPMSDGGEWLTDRSKNKYWKEVSSIYSKNCGSGRNTPQSLEENLDFSGKLRSQLDQGDKWNVVYNKSGVRLYAAVVSSSYLVENSTYRVPCKSRDEAYYLAGVLTCDTIQDAVTMFKSSERHIDTQLWSNIPIPRYVPANPVHKKIAELCKKAEKKSLSTYDRKSGTQKMRKAALEAVRRSCIMADLDASVAKILPGHTTLNDDDVQPGLVASEASP